MGFMSHVKEMMGKNDVIEEEFIEGSQEEYVELGSDEEIATSSKVLIRPFTLDDFEDIKPVIDSLREGNSIALINIAPLKEKEITELKRAIAKLRKTCDALEGEIAGFTEDLIIATSKVAKIHHKKPTSEDV